MVPNASNDYLSHQDLLIEDIQKVAFCLLCVKTDIKIGVYEQIKKQFEFQDEKPHIAAMPVHCRP